MIRGASLPAAARRRAATGVLVGIVLLAAAGARADDVGTEDEPAPPPREGIASWYGGKFHGRQTACGELFDENELTAAHLTLPFGTRIAVTNLDNGCRITLRVTDRGPYVGDRILDCSRAAADMLGFLDKGLARIRWDVVEHAPPRTKRRRPRTPRVAPPALQEVPRPIVPIEAATIPVLREAPHPASPPSSPAERLAPW